MYKPPHRHNQYTCIYHPMDTINIHVYTTQINNQHTCIYHPYPQSIYMCISPHRRNQYTCIYHPYKQSIYMYIPPIYTINIHVYTTHIHNQYTCIYHPYTQSIYLIIDRNLCSVHEEITAIRFYTPNNPRSGLRRGVYNLIEVI
jgi:hypothetical protein